MWSMGDRVACGVITDETKVKEQLEVQEQIKLPPLCIFLRTINFVCISDA
jgi:hypothetical protein